MHNNSIDDLEIGKWVAVTACKLRELTVGSGFDQQTIGLENATHWGYTVTGMPMQVQQIQLPFVVFYDPVALVMFPLDIRLVELMILDREYVNTFTRNARDMGRGAVIPKALPESKFPKRPNNWQRPSLRFVCSRCNHPVGTAQEGLFPVCAVCQQREAKEHQQRSPQQGSPNQQNWPTAWGNGGFFTNPTPPPTPPTDEEE